MTRIVPDATLTAPLLGGRHGKASPGFSLAFQQAIAAALSEDGTAPERFHGEATRDGNRDSEGNATGQAHRTGNAEAPEGVSNAGRAGLADLLSTTSASRPQDLLQGETAAAQERLAKMSARVNARVEARLATRTSEPGADPDAGRVDLHRGERTVPKTGLSNPMAAERSALAGPQAQTHTAVPATLVPQARVEAHRAEHTDGASRRAASEGALRLPPRADAPAEPHRQLMRGDPRAASGAERGETGAERITANGRTAPQPAAGGAAPRLGQDSGFSPARQTATGGAPPVSPRLATADATKRTPRQPLDPGAEPSRSDRVQPQPSGHSGRGEIVANVVTALASELDHEQQRRRLPSLRAAERNVASETLSPTVTRRETHFAPVMMPQGRRIVPGAAGTFPASERAAPVSDPAGPPSDNRAPTEQLGRVLERAIPELRAAEVRAPALPNSLDAAARPQAPQSQGPVRVVELQLQPATLGSLTVTMRLSPGGLKVNVMTTVRETATRLSEDRAELTQLIRRAGYDASEITVEAASAPQGGGAGEDNAPSQGERRDPQEQRQPRERLSEGRGRRALHV